MKRDKMRCNNLNYVCDVRVYACVREEEGFRGCDSKDKGTEGEMQRKRMME